MSERPICNYEGSKYSTEFWVKSRAYEDAVERVALRALLPPRGKTLIEIGAGFGRLVDLYDGYDTVVMLDYAHTQLAQAVERLGDGGTGGRPRYIYVQANFYHLPFVSGSFETVTMVRTLHHAADAPAVLDNVSRVLAPSGALVLEFANKQNLKAIARYVLGRQSWSPFDRAPVEFVDLNFDFHPRWVWAQMADRGLEREAVRTVSHFRVNLLKRWLPTKLLVGLDSIAQHTGPLWQLSPSVFVRARADATRAAAGAEDTSADDGAFFCCPACGEPLGAPPQSEFACSQGHTWRKQSGIYDFRYPTD